MCIAISEKKRMGTHLNLYTPRSNWVLMKPFWIIVLIIEDASGKPS